METKHSKKFGDIKFYYDYHIWSKATVKKACKLAASPPPSMRKS